MQLNWLNPDHPEAPFPDLDQALAEPNGLLAFDGCLSTIRLLNAYRAGIFPWYNPGEPILWWSPDPRLVLFPEHLHISRSLAKTLRKTDLRISFDQAFAEVMQACAAPRSDGNGTWINHDMYQAYCQLHEIGVAHSVEAWLGEDLVGGLYGLSIGKIFFGESMFHRYREASKVAFVHLVQKLCANDYQLIDCQVKSDHLMSLGASEISRSQFRSILDQFCSCADAWIK